MAILVQKKVHEKISVASLTEAEDVILTAAECATAEKPVELTIELDHGTVKLDKPLVLSAKEHPGLANVSLTVKAKSGMRPVLTDMCRLDNRKFETVCGKEYVKYQFEADENGKYPLFRELFVDGKRITPARSGLFIHPFNIADKNNRRNPENMRGFYLPAEEVEMFRTYAPGRTMLNMYVEWEAYTVHLESVDFSDTKELNGKTYVLTRYDADEMENFITRFNGCNDLGGRECYFDNALPLLQPGSFVYDDRHGTLYVYPTRPFDRWTNVSYPTLENLLILDGLNHTVFEGVTFSGLTSKFICEHGYLCGQANNEQRVGRLTHAAFLTSDMRDFTLRDCTFRD
ncbi:MAG: hypothetical protein MJ078_03465, partial [Clostridia bacterium]|nr:hypothetical protein [Clostridia bacterium]